MQITHILRYDLQKHFARDMPRWKAYKKLEWFCLAQPSAAARAASGSVAKSEPNVLCNI